VFEATPMMLALLPLLDGTHDHASLQAHWPGQPIDVALAELVHKGFVLAADHGVE
jgi:hypothetical protein